MLRLPPGVEAKPRDLKLKSLDWFAPQALCSVVAIEAISSSLPLMYRDPRNFA